MSPDEGREETTGVIDAHHHHVPPGFSEQLFAGHAGALTDAEYLAAERRIRFASMDGDSVEQAVIMPGHGYLRPDGVRDTWRLNEALAAYSNTAPERFAATLGIVEPLYGPRGRSQLADFGSLNLAGVAFHTRFQGVATDSPLVRAVVADMVDLGLIPFVHAGQSSEEALWRVQQLACAFPSTTFIVLDGLDSFEQSNQSLVCAEHAPNTIFDTAGCPDMEFVLRFVHRFGSHRLVSGSNTYSRVTPSTKRSIFPQLREQDVRPEDLAAILGDTMRSVLAGAQA